MCPQTHICWGRHYHTFILPSHCSCSSELWDKSSTQWSFMVIITPRTLLPAAEPSLPGRASTGHSLEWAHWKKNRRRYFFDVCPTVINIKWKKCLAFQKWRNTGFLMQRAYCGGTFEVWMNNDMRVKERGCAGAFTRSWQRQGRLPALLSTQKKWECGNMSTNCSNGMALSKRQPHPLWYQQWSAHNTAMRWAKDVGIIKQEREFSKQYLAVGFEKVSPRLGQERKATMKFWHQKSN